MTRRLLGAVALAASIAGCGPREPQTVTLTRAAISAPHCYVEAVTLRTGYRFTPPPGFRVAGVAMSQSGSHGNGFRSRAVVVLCDRRLQGPEP